MAESTDGEERVVNGWSIILGVRLRFWVVFGFYEGSESVDSDYNEKQMRCRLRHGPLYHPPQRDVRGAI
jgi:hypothetical protein